MAADRRSVTASSSSSAEEPARTTKPGVTGVVCIVLAVLLAGLAALWFWASSTDTALVGPASATVVLALLCALIGIISFQVARRNSGASPLTGPLLLFTILAFVSGVAGAVLGIAVGAAQGSVVAIGAGVGVFVASLIVAVQGVLVHGAARHRA